MADSRVPRSELPFFAANRRESPDTMTKEEKHVGKLADITSLNTLTNYTKRLADTKIEFPVAKVGD